MFLARLLAKLFISSRNIISSLPRKASNFVLYDVLNLNALQRATSFKSQMRNLTIRLLRLSIVWRTNFMTDLVAVGKKAHRYLKVKEKLNRELRKKSRKTIIALLDRLDQRYKKTSRQQIMQIMAVEALNPSKMNDGGLTNRELAKFRKRDIRAINKALTNEQRRLGIKTKQQKGSYKYTSFPNSPMSWLGSGEWFKETNNGISVLRSSNNSIFDVSMSSKYFERMSRSVRPGKVLWDGPWFYKRTASLKTRTGKRLLRIYGATGKKYLT